LAASVGWPVRIGLWMEAVERHSLRRLILRSRLVMGASLRQ
jgi:hypothetical protein